MPPRRPLTDLCLIAVMKMLTPNDQLKTAQMSPRCAILVRAANRRVKMLVIARSEYFDGEGIKYNIDSLSLASTPSMKLLPAGGEPFPDYPRTTTRISKWNCLLVDEDQHLDQPTVEQIVNAFSAVTDLKFENRCLNINSENLIALLERQEWTNQLTSLAVFGWSVNLATEPRLISAINALSALQFLAMRYYGSDQLPELSILSQLKAIAIRLGGRADGVFLRSLEHHAAGNVDLQVLLHGYDYYRLFGLSEPVRRRILRVGNEALFCSRDYVSLLCRRLPSLTSVSVGCSEAPELEAFFTALSTLPQLVHLKLELDWEREEGNQFVEPTPPPRPLAQLTSLKAFDLQLLLHSHEQMQWLKHLPVTMPRLQVIHLEDFRCASCGVALDSYLRGDYSEDTSPSISTALECLRATLPLLHHGVSQDRIILSWRKHPTLKELMSTSE